MKTTPWLDDVQSGAQYPTLDHDVTADVVVVGAGIVGTFAAYALMKEGKNVVLIDKGTIEDSTTAYTTAFITRIIDTDLSELVSIYGETRARLIWKSGQDAVERIEEVITGESIDCEFARVPEFLLAFSQKELDALEREATLSKKLGFNDVRLHTEKTFPFETFGYLEIVEQASFHPLKFLVALRERFVARGGTLYEKTEATDIQETEHGVVVTTAHGTITAQHGIIATYKPFNGPRELFGHTAMYTSYVFEVELLRGTLHQGLYLDQANPYHYFRIDKQADVDRMILGGEDHRAEIPLKPEKSYTALEDYLKKLLPNTAYKIVRKWDSGVLETIDGLPYVGRFSKKTPRILVATGFSGNGMHYSALAATLLTDLILGRNNPYAIIYDAGRRTTFRSFVKKVKDFTGEFFGGAIKNLLR